MGLWETLKGTFGSQSKRPTPRDLFAAEIETAIKETFPGASVRHLPDAYGFLVNRGRHDQSAFLDSIFQETRDVGPERKQVLIGLSSGASRPRTPRG